VSIDSATRSIALGDRASLSKIISTKDVRRFAEISGDHNPVHLDMSYAAQTRFGRPIAHGMLVAGLISAVLGTELPGPGSIYLSQTLQFRAPVYINDRITAAVEVIAIRPDKPIVTLKTVCTNQIEQVVLEGEAVLLVPLRGYA
jgi:3-hydroxybutyryl-CoA dehydratase